MKCIPIRYTSFLCFHLYIFHYFNLHYNTLHKVSTYILIWQVYWNRSLHVIGIRSSWAATVRGGKQSAVCLSQLCLIALLVWAMMVLCMVCAVIRYRGHDSHSHVVYKAPCGFISTTVILRGISIILTGISNCIALSIDNDSLFFYALVN